jgi:dTDP-4-amino-4,6-dideoxygalactose transaminase
MSSGGAIKMNDFAGEPETLRRAQLAACDRVLRSGWWILGQEVSAFESEWAAWLGAANAVGCANGLDAIEIGLRALGIGPGDEVITTSMTAFATVLAVIRAGATPVLADIDAKTAMLSTESVKRCIGTRTKAILLVHLYGQIGPVQELLPLAREHGLHLIEDCAQAHGAKWRGNSAGSFGDFAAWSFYPTKNLGAVGDGGAITTPLPKLAEDARCLRNYGQTVRYHHPVLGMNSRLDEIQAAILRERLRYLNVWVERRREIARRYTAELVHPEVRVMPLPADQDRHAHHLFVVTSDRRDDLQRYLRSKEIDSLIHYPIPIHFQEPCRNLARDPQGLMRTEQHAASCLSIPCHPGLTNEQTDKVTSAINGFGA